MLRSTTNNELIMSTETAETADLVPDASATALTSGDSETLPPLRLWLVDDNDRLRHTVAELLARTPGIECTREFPSATAALSALASKHGPDVILLDIQMGEENGLDAVRPIKSLSRSTRVFMFTTLSDNHARMRARENGASGFLLKRCPIEEIIRTIRQPGEFDGSPRPRRQRTAGAGATVRTDGSDSCVATVGASTKPDAPHALDRCLRLIRSFWN